jgi:tetratricopeptide (TPR) repeat protein
MPVKVTAVRTRGARIIHFPMNSAVSSFPAQFHPAERTARSGPLHGKSCFEEATLSSIRTIIAEKVQEHISKANWKAAISEMEKLFAVHQDPLIRVRIGDVRRKLNRQDEAIREYLHAAELFAERGFVVKALAQYRLALRLDPSNADIRSTMERLRLHCPVVKLKRGPAEYRPPDPIEETATCWWR